MRKNYKQINTNDKDLQLLQANVDEAFKGVLACDLIDGVFIKNVSLTASQDNLVSHGLGREPQMWIVVRNNANSVVWEKTSPSISRVLNLWCSATCTVNLWVA